jgi:serine phosphatase RsbU (regulator of sigma subunit)
MARKVRRSKDEKPRKRKKAAEEEVPEEELEEQEDKPQQRAKRDRTKDSSVIYKSGEMPRMRGGGVARRLAFAISGTVLVIMIIVAIVMMIIISGAIDEQIDAGGVVASRLLASTDVEFWKGTYGIDAGTQDRSEQEARQAFNKERLQRVLGENSQMLNATILVDDGFGGFTIRRTAQDPYMKLKEAPQFSSKAAGKDFKVGEVLVEYGIISINNRVYDCRQYRAPIMDYKGKRTGYAMVVLSEDKITSTKWSMAGTVAILFVFFVGIGVGVSFLVGRKISEPVKALIEDVTAVASGDLNHHTVPRSTDEIGLLARTFDKMTKNLQEAQSREVEMAAQRHQMAVAQEVQSNLLPEKIPDVPGYEIVAFHRSSKEVDGNYYDVIQYANGKLGVLVAAASGKGIPAAMVMTMARSFFRALMETAEGPAAMMRQANRLLSPDLRAGMYVEVLMVLIDPTTHKAKLVSAGPTSLFRFSFAEKKLQGIHAEGIALGFDKGPVFDKSLKEVEFDMGPGDRLVLNTPGVFSVKNYEGMDLGVKGFAKAINKQALKPSDEFVTKVVNIIDNYAGHEVEDSDITFLTVRRLES